MKNRTGPQLRLLRNYLDGIGGSIVLRSTGCISNRDAIGATVTIESGAQRQTKFISAGSGFASQHTKELFFGLSDAKGPISISIRWPSGKVHRYDGLPVNHRTAIEGGTPTFRSDPHRPAPTASALASPAPVSTRSATWLIAPLFAPDLRLPDARGNIEELSNLTRTSLKRLGRGNDVAREMQIFRQSREAASSITDPAGISLAQFISAIDASHQESGPSLQCSAITR